MHMLWKVVMCMVATNDGETELTHPRTMRRSVECQLTNANDDAGTVERMYILQVGAYGRRL